MRDLLFNILNELYEQRKLEERSLTQKEWEESLTDKQKDVIEDWARFNYPYIKRAERLGKITKDLEKFYDAIKGAPPYKGIIYRVGELGKTFTKENLKVGLVIKFDSHTSFTSSKKEAKKFLEFSQKYEEGKDLYFLQLTISSGIDIRNLTKMFREEEIIVRKGTTIKITSFSVSNNLTKINAVEI